MTTNVIAINRTVVFEKTLEHMQCPMCSVDYALGKNFIAQRREDHRNWYCPNGHRLHYPQDNTEERAIKARDAARELAARESERRRRAEGQARLAEYRRRAAKGQLTKIRNRLTAGLCPCCGKEFPEMAAHLAERHPGFTIPAKVDVTA